MAFSRYTMTEKTQPFHKSVSLLRYLPLAGVVIVACLYFVLRRTISIESLLLYWQGRWAAAALVLLLLYAVKSVSVFLPLAMLYVASGSVFSPWAAVLLNIAGLIVCVTIPFYIGRWSGSELAVKLTAKYPHLAHMAEKQLRNQWFVSFFLRAVSFLPGDVVSMYLGSLGLTYGKYLTGSLVGLLPMMLSWTLMGANITAIGSEEFWASLALLVAVMLLSSVIYVIIRRRAENSRRLP